MKTFQYPFEELADFWHDDFRSGAHNGVATIAPLTDGEWAVVEIQLDCHNGGCGPAAQSKLITLSRSYQAAMFEALCDSLRHFSGAHIEDRIAEIEVEMPRRSALLMAAE